MLDVKSSISDLTCPQSSTQNLNIVLPSDFDTSANTIAEKVCFRGPNDIGHLAWLIKLSFRITTLINPSRRMLLLISNLVIMYLCIYGNVGR
jgi:hypothetical protein